MKFIILGLLALIIGGSASYVYTQPETVLESVVTAVSAYEKSTIERMVSALMVEEGITELPTVISVATNDMSKFPSEERPLYPDYLKNRLSYFSYTVDAKGKVEVIPFFLEFKEKYKEATE